MKPPNWTVTYCIVKKDAVFLGKGWEFFYNEDAAQRCYDEQIKLGNVPMKRPFHPNDKLHMNPVDVWGCNVT